MKYEVVKFAKFSVNPETILQTLPQYKQPWPDHWSIVCVQRDYGLASLTNTPNDIHAWIKENATGATDTYPLFNGDVLVAFEDKSDSLIFKISIDGAV